MNPATTLAYFVLGKVQLWDAVFYIVSQFVGGAAGVAIARLVLGQVIRHSSVCCVITSPPDDTRRAARTAWLAEFIIAFVLFLTVLITSNRIETARFTPLCVGLLIAVYITVEAPLSGMSMNPARTLGSAIHAREYHALWVYFTAPPLAMMAAAIIYTASPGGHQVYCAKLDHPSNGPCIFNCRIGEMPREHDAATRREVWHPRPHALR